MMKVENGAPSLSPLARRFNCCMVRNSGPPAGLHADRSSRRAIASIAHRPCLWCKFAARRLREADCDHCVLEPEQLNQSHPRARGRRFEPVQEVGNSLQLSALRTPDAQQPPGPSIPEPDPLVRDEYRRPRCSKAATLPRSDTGGPPAHVDDHHSN